MERCDLVIIGGGPAGLAAAIAADHLAKMECAVEQGSRHGAEITGRE